MPAWMVSLMAGMDQGGKSSGAMRDYLKYRARQIKTKVGATDSADAHLAQPAMMAFHVGVAGAGEAKGCGPSHCCNTQLTSRHMVLFGCLHPCRATIGSCLS